MGKTQQVKDGKQARVSSRLLFNLAISHTSSVTLSEQTDEHKHGCGPRLLVVGHGSDSPGRQRLAALPFHPLTPSRVVFLQARLVPSIG